MSTSEVPGPVNREENLQNEIERLAHRLKQEELDLAAPPRLRRSRDLHLIPRNRTFTGATGEDVEEFVSDFGRIVEHHRLEEKDAREWCVRQL